MTAKKAKPKPKSKFEPTGIVHITGEKDSGKTLLALTAYPPSRTAYFFDDVKRPPVPPGDFGLYVDLVQEFADLKLLEYHTALLELIMKIKQDAYDAIVFDTWARAGLAARNFVIQNPGKFREMQTYSRMGAAKGGEMWNEAHRYESALISALASKAKYVALVTHTKDMYIGGAKSGLLRPDCGKSFDKICNLRLWLRHNPSSGVPTALVLKRIVRVLTDAKTGYVQPVNVLPRKLVPSEMDHSLWETIERYWETPIGNVEPKAEETPNAYELSILDGVLTTDQKMVWQAELDELKRAETDEITKAAEDYVQFSALVKKLAIGHVHLPIPMRAAKVFEDLQPDEKADYTPQDVADILQDDGNG